jgi:hypothetical protein
MARLRVANMCPPGDIRKVLEYAIRRIDNPVDASAILRAFTTVRKQTARDRETGAPRRNTLRATRAVLKGTIFQAPLKTVDFTDEHWRVLARMCLNVRHAGAARNRGPGHIRLALTEGGRDRTGELARLE